MLTITDAMGRTVLQQRVNAGRTTMEEALVPGLYLVRLSDGPAQRLVVQ